MTKTVMKQLMWVGYFVMAVAISYSYFHPSYRVATVTLIMANLSLNLAYYRRFRKKD